MTTKAKKDDNKQLGVKKLKVNTSTLKNLLSKVMKGISDNKILFITGAINIEFDGKKLTLSATDTITYLSVFQEDGANLISGDEMRVAVPAHVFNQLIQKTNSLNVELVLEDACLKVIGNGVYKIELPTESGGSLLEFPRPNTLNDVKPAQLRKTTITKEDIASILKSNKTAIKTSLMAIFMHGYYFGDKVVTSDCNMVAQSNVKVTEEPFLAPPELLNILEAFNDNTVEVTRHGSNIMMSGSNMLVCSIELEDIASYPIIAIDKMLSSDYPSKCTISKELALSILDRMKLFVGQYDGNAVQLVFDSNGVSFLNKRSTGNERIEFDAKAGANPFICNVDLQLLVDVLKAQPCRSLEIQYGAKRTLKIVGDDTAHLITLVADELDKVPEV